MSTRAEATNVHPTLVEMGTVGREASSHLLTASAVIGFDSDVDSSLHERVMTAAGQLLEKPLSAHGHLGLRLEQLGAHRSVLLENGALAMCVTVPAEFSDELLALSVDVESISIDPRTLRASQLRPPLPLDPLDAARKLALIALGHADGTILGGRSGVMPWTDSAAVRPVSVTLVGPAGTFVSGKVLLPLGRSQVAIRPFLGILHVRGANQVQVLRTGPGSGAYGTRSWVSDRLLEQRMASAPDALSEVLRREGLSYGASMRLAASRPPFVMSASYSVPAAGLARSLEVLEIALAAASARARDWTETDLSASLDVEVRQVLADSERAAVTFWGAGSVLPDTFRPGLHLAADGPAALFERPRELGREFAVTILVGDEDVIRQNAPEIAVDRVWGTAETKRDA